MVKTIQALRQCLNAHRILFPDRIETMIRVTVNSGIDLVSSRIHDRADKFVSIPYIVRDCRRRWNGNQWFFKCQTKSLSLTDRIMDNPFMPPYDSSIRCNKVSFRSFLPCMFFYKSSIVSILYKTYILTVRLVRNEQSDLFRNYPNFFFCIFSYRHQRSFQLFLRQII